jgi:hypothetical protein
MEPTTNSGSNRSGVAKRYLPVLAVVVVVAIAAGVFAIVSGGGDDDDGGGDSSASAPAETGVVVFEDGDDPDDFTNCDPDTGRVAIPDVYAAPCVETFDGDNGGATAPGVTGDSIKLVIYNGDPALDPLQSAQVESSGANLDVGLIQDTEADYIDLFNDYYELYGRQVDVEFYVGTGGPADEVKAKADAIAIAEKEPFAVIGGPTQAAVFGEEITARGIICMYNCSLAAPADFVAERAPYAYPDGPNPEQAADLTVEMIGTQLVGGQAEYAGDPELQSQDRVFGYLHYDTPDGRYQAGAEAFIEQMQDENGVELAVEIPFFLDIPRAQEISRTAIAQLKDAGVTTVVFQGDPLMPKYFTEEATRQDYFPEWVIGPSVLVDTATFGRTFDQEQWAHAFGISLPAANGEAGLQESHVLYEFGYCAAPPSNIAAILVPAIRWFFNGLTLAGPDLTPDTFEAGMFAFPPSGGGPSRPATSRGDHGIWPETDWNGTDDAAFIWWDPEAEGETGTGLFGQGMYRFVNEGERFLPGGWPDDPVPLFDPEGTVVSFDELKPEDDAPDYPSPCA